MRVLLTIAFAIAAAGAAFGPATAKEQDTLSLVFCCQPQNDLYQVLTSASARSLATSATENDLYQVLIPPSEGEAKGGYWPRFDTAAQAVENAPEGAGVLVLADGYPEKTTEVESAVFETAAAERLRLYVEYPTALPGLEVGPTRGTQWERAVVASDVFGPTLAKSRILAIHDCHFVPVKADQPHLVVARVAGFDTAVYGLPPETFPILFEHPRGDLLVATTKLSQFVTARYAPTEAWRVIWHTILAWLCPGQAVPVPSWTPTVRPSYGPTEALPPDAEAQAFRRGAEWFRRSDLLARSSTPQELAKPHDLHFPISNFQSPISSPEGAHGILEGYGAQIRWDGRQPQQESKRGDCTGESAMALAFGGPLGQDETDTAIAANLLDYWYFHSIAQQGVRADPSHPAFGLVAWGISNWAWEKAFYGDDNARLLLGTVAAAALLKSDRWDEAVLKCLLANLRTTGRYGFRPDRIDLPDLEANGWQPYFEGFTISYAPHYQAYLWACFLWAYRHTGYELFLQRAESAIRMTMAAYPDHWRWTNGIAQERARMLLPLAWLVRVQDTPEHRGWLRRIAADLLTLQSPCGAIREELGPPGQGAYGPPRSNEEYGTNEATLLQANGDPVCDLLYTTNFAFLGLHEAAAATGDPFYADAEEKLAKFLGRIQVRSERHPELDGGWFRAFDFERWEYWASSADAGWGAWSIETGWTQGWITAVLGLRQMNTSLWDLTAGSQIGDHFARLHPLFFPEGDQVATSESVQHLALGQPVKLAIPYDPRYPGGGDGALTDGRRGLADHRDPAWQGFQGPDLDATIDLGEIKALQSIRSGYLQETRVGVFLPSSMEYAVSDDGQTFRVVATVANDVPADREGPLTREFKAEVAGTTARYVRVHAKNVGKIPDWHPAKGLAAWLFVDEIVIE